MLGSPVGHSLSPTLHRAAYAELGLDWDYQPHEVTAAGLPSFLASLGDEWRGLSLTMPLKETVIGLCSTVSRQARLVAAVNTVLLEPPDRVEGLNTDIPGFVATWRSAGVRSVGRAVVVGAGATARSAVAALAELGTTHVTVLARSPARADGLTALSSTLGLGCEVRRLDEAASIGRVDLAVSTVPATGQTGDWVENLVGRTAAVCDVVYSPRETPLLQAGRRAGLACSEGFDLLLHQAARQVELMTGVPQAPVQAMRAAGLRELERRA